MSVPLYLRYVAISLKSQMQYKASFIMQSFGHLVVTGLEFLALWALFDRFGSLKGWSLPEAAFFYGIVNVSFSVADALSRGFDVFAGFVKNGDFDRMLLRPRSTVIQLAGYEVTLRRVGRFTQAAAVLIWSAVTLGIPLSAENAALFSLSVAGTAALFMGLMIIQAGICFWTTESLEIMNILTYGGVETAQYPLAVYRRFFRRFFMFVVPLGCVSYFPVVSIIGKIDPLGAPPWTGWAAPFAGFAFLSLALLFWRLAVRRYTSTGS